MKNNKRNDDLCSRQFNKEYFIDLFDRMGLIGAEVGITVNIMGKKESAPSCNARIPIYDVRGRCLYL